MKEVKSKKLKRSTYWLPYIGLFITWLTVHQAIRFFTHMQVVGSQNVRDAEAEADRRGVGIIFAMNHTSRLLDPFFVTAASTPYYPSYPMFYVTGKMDMYKVYSSGFAKLIYNDFVFKMLGSQYIHSGKKDYSKSLKRHVDILNAGHSVCIFPEGELSKDGTLGKAHGGVGYLAIETGAIVVPIYTVGGLGMSLSEFFMRKRHVVVSYGKFISSLDFKPSVQSEKNKYQQYANIVMDNIAHRVDESEL